MRLPLLTWCCTLLFPVLAASCGNDNDSPPETVAGGNFGPEGGSLTVTSGPLAGASITIPPRALTTTVGVSIFQDQVSLVPGYKDVGPAMRIEPNGLQLLLPGLLTLPFDPLLVPPTATSEDFLVRYRLADGRVFEALPRQIDASIGRATLDVLQFATFWVTVLDQIDMRAYLPLGDGDGYEYDSGLRLTVSETRTEPNFLGIPLTKMMFSTPFLFFSGMYLVDDAAGALSLFGEFDVGTENRQERLDGAAPLLSPVEGVGTSHELFYTFTGFVPYGGPIPAYLGAAHATVSIVERTSIATLAGTFDDVVLLEFAVERGDSRPRNTQFRLRFWLANGVGPVQVQEDQLSPHRLVAAVVGGVPIPR